MAIPDYESIMLPLLQLLSDRKARPLREFDRGHEWAFPPYRRRTRPSAS